VYHWVEHTAELELEITAASEREVLADALAALAELLSGEAAPPGEPADREVRVAAADRPALLAGWLQELVYLAESEGFVARALARLDLGERELTATVTGTLDAPPPLVKAVTYHRLKFESGDGGYVARVVLDV
jgi:SHS2 domain-containing protein